MTVLSLAATGEPTSGLASWAVRVIEEFGGPGAAVLVGLDNLFPPIPSELVLPLAGLAASRGAITLTGALFWTTLGSVLGAVVVYHLGRLLGRERTRALISRVPLVDVTDFDRTERWFARHGTKAVLLARLVPIFRSLVSLPAGVERMRLPVFLALTTLGSLLWNAILVGAGYVLAENWHVVAESAEVFQTLVVVVVLGAVAVFATARLRRRRARRRATCRPSADDESRR